MDEGFRHAITRQLRERGVDVVTAQEVGLVRTPDPVILEWAANEGRIVITDDVSTMREYANDRLRAGLPVPGVLLIPQSIPIGIAVEEIQTIAEASDDAEWRDRVEFIPLRSPPLR